MMVRLQNVVLMASLPLNDGVSIYFNVFDLKKIDVGFLKATIRHNSTQYVFIHVHS